MIIAVCGFRGSGKSLFGEVARWMGFPVFEMSEPVLEEMKRRNMPITNAGVREFATEIRKTGGKDVVAKMLCEKIAPAISKDKYVVVIGARSVDEINVFRKLGRTVCVALVADEKKRLLRTKRRGKPSDPKDLSGLRWADEIEKKWGLGELVEKCDEKIENNSSLEEFEAKAKAVLGKYGAGNA